ncbi:hypothetical protein ACIP5Y_15670 [Nocardia sp. NPDC088792]|uniref:hypothetical protein n=1 Tax=Nocardia sp. NPDC088792 TaxID=3364332 RepID=UPI0038168914
MDRNRSGANNLLGFVNPINNILSLLTGSRQPLLNFVDNPVHQAPAPNNSDPDLNSPYGHPDISQDPFFKGMPVFVSPAMPDDAKSANGVDMKNHQQEAPAATVFADAARNIMGQHIVNAAEYWMTHSMDGRVWTGPNVTDLPRTGRPTWTPVNGTPGTQYSWGGGSIDGPTRGVETDDPGDGSRIYHDSTVTGFDCAHLVEFAIYQGSGHKIDIGAYTVSQYNKVNQMGWQHPDLNNLKPGDILWSEPDTKQGYVTGSNGKSIGAPAHVVIFAGYDGNHNPTYVEAPESGQKIREVTMDQAAFEKSFGMYTAARPPLALGDPSNPYIQPQQHAAGGDISHGLSPISSGLPSGDKLTAAPTSALNSGSRLFGHKTPLHQDESVRVLLSQPASTQRASQNDRNAALAHGRRM